ncbi:UDP-2,4-diacetamido-2,4,6-trideoxy-beta-L-altropyranose hydrolase [Pseudobutyrivibrio xylanivorans]|uniref:UDP-2,4-diacetamido-2,4, 6-trideoxy-beta-L-altropyranose hydrolase n=2 Tax=Lachnospiraceae TaxID=186803 RepID=A0A6M0LH24_PSEXY|nr:UDP-2,4-diacetamido-2,4,6-trideoxy-beta-L-altropyranose hydrolase [Pseudobutyrivibrio xylanivorans]
MYASIHEGHFLYEEVMIIFRADGNDKIGAGHVMRCLNMAEQYIDEGIEVLFLTADDSFSQRIVEAGCNHIILNSDYNNMIEEIEQIESIVDEYNPTMFIVDSYFVTDEYMRRVKRVCNDKGCKLTYIDDVLAFAYPCDILINYNIYGPDCKSEYKKIYSGANVVLPELKLGLEYLPLRKEYKNIPPRKEKGEIKDVFISTGGADTEHIGLALLKYIKRNPVLDKYNFHFVIGAVNTDKEKIEKIAKEQSNIITYFDLTSLKDLMLKCDVAISAAGSTLYELYATHTPTVTYIVADNQIRGARGFEKAGLMKCCGDIRELGATVLAERLLTEVLCQKR